MPKINEISNRFYKFYLIGFYIILLLPLLVLPPWFFPVDWGKTIVFRSISAILLFLFVFQLLYKRNEIKLPDIKKNKIVLVLALFFILVLLATLFSQDVNFSLWGSPYRSGGSVNFAFYVLFGVLSFLIFKNSADWKKLLDFSILVGVLVCLIAFIQFYSLFGNIFIPVAGRPPATMGNPIVLGLYLVLLFFITLSFAIKEPFNSVQSKIKKTFYGFALLFFLYTILITGSRAAYLGILIGGIYFGLFFLKKYQKKLLPLKIGISLLILSGAAIIYFMNTTPEMPKFIQENKLFEAIYVRLSIKEVLIDPRFSAWQVVIKEIKENPILGWGPENLAIGFDKYYDPSFPYINKAWGGWWDKAHNTILETAATTGILSAIIYLTLFATLFWQLQKLKNPRQSAIIRENPIIPHGMQATLIAYLATNFFTFDGFSTYLLFFLIIGYSLHLTSQDNTVKINNQKTIKAKELIMATLLIILILFLWQYNILPLKINAQINKSDNFADNNKCDLSLLTAEKNISKNHSFLDAYTAIHYIEAIKKCAETNPENNLEYAKKGAEFMKGAVKIRPLYSRLWLYLGSFTTIKANAEQNLENKEALLKEAHAYFEKASQLAPNHQEILVEWAKTNMIDRDYKAMEEKAEKCVALDPSLSDCYWTKALSKIYLKNFTEAKKNVELANSKMLDNSLVPPFLRQMANAYAYVENYAELSLIYEKLIELKPSVAQYHSSLAFTYFKMKEYKKARREAMIFLELMPEEKEEVEIFLRMFPPK